VCRTPRCLPWSAEAHGARSRRWCRRRRSSQWAVIEDKMTLRILVVLIAGASMQASAQTRPPEPAPQNPPLTLAQVTMSPDATKRAHLQEINLETARKLADACVSYSRSANPNGGATVVVVGPSGNIVYAARSDGQIPNNFDSAFEKAKMALYM